MSCITRDAIIDTVEARDARAFNDRSRDQVAKAVDHAFGILEWEPIPAVDVEFWGCDQVGDEIFCDLTPRQANRLHELVDEAIAAATARIWAELRGAVADVAVAFHAEQPDARLRRDHALAGPEHARPQVAGVR